MGSERFDVTFERDTFVQTILPPTKRLPMIVIAMLNYGTFGVKFCVTGDFLGLHGFGLKRKILGPLALSPIYFSR